LSVLVTQDLFAAGIGCDIAGGYLVVRGLLLDDIELRRLAGTYVGLSYGDLAARIRDRVDARLGLAALTLGFALQAAGYIAGLWTAPSDHGRNRGIAAGLLAIATAIAVLAFWRALRATLVKRHIVRISRVDANNRVVLQHPLRGVLIPLGEEAGFPKASIDGVPEEDERYAKRVFGVDELFPGAPF
jgi:hypothetical protein